MIGNTLENHDIVGKDKNIMQITSKHGFKLISNTWREWDCFMGMFWRLNLMDIDFSGIFNNQAYDITIYIHIIIHINISIYPYSLL